MITSILITGKISRIHDNGTATLESTIIGQLHNITLGCKIKLRAITLIADYPKAATDVYAYAIANRSFVVTSNLSSRPAYLTTQGDEFKLQNLRNEWTPLLIFLARITPKENIFIDNSSSEYYDITTPTKHCEFYIKELNLPTVAVAEANSLDYGFKVQLHLSIEIP